MTNASVSKWEQKRTEETRHVEDVLRKAGFQQAEAYRYNSASIRVRVIDPQFVGKNSEQRDNLVEPFLETLPERTQADIINLLTLTPEEAASVSSREYLRNLEFDNPSPSML